MVSIALSTAGKRIGAILLAIVVLVLGFLSIGTYVDGGSVLPIERNVFLIVNSWPESLTYPMIAVQYTGLLFIPALAAAVALIYKKFLLAGLLVLIIPTKIFLESVIKSQFQRERPKVYIPEAILRGDVQAGGLSFTSGHAIIIFAICTLVTPFVPAKVRYIIWSVALLCIVARVYLGAHLPLDVIGGAIIGTCVGLVLYAIYVLLGKIIFRKKQQNLSQ